MKEPDKGRPIIPGTLDIIMLLCCLRREEWGPCPQSVIGLMTKDGKCNTGECNPLETVQCMKLIQLSRYCGWPPFSGVLPRYYYLGLLFPVLGPPYSWLSIVAVNWCIPAVCC